MIIESHATRDLDRASADARIQELTREITALKVHRNAMAPIAFLPSEIILEIILFYAHAEGIFSTKWMKVLYICRRWHAIAMGNSQLWSYIRHRVGYDRRVRALVERSREHPLTFVLEWQNTDWDEGPSLLRNQAHRIYSLKMTDQEMMFPITFQGSTDFPILEQLELQALTDQAMPHIPTFFLQGGAPRLHVIRLVQVDFLSRWDLFNDLTELSLSRPIEEEPLPSFEELFATLQRSPRLRILRLKNYLPREELAILSVYLPALPVISLPFLQELDLKGHVASVTVMLQCMALPPTSALHLFTTGVTSGFEISPLLVLVTRHIHRTGAPTLRSLSFFRFPLPHGEASIAADVHESCSATRHLEGDKALPHLVFTTSPKTQRAVRRIITRILDSLPLNSATHLNLDATMMLTLSAETWRTMFLHIPCLETVKIGVNEALPGMLDGLLSAMRRGPYGLTGKKRRRASQGWFSWPSRLVLLASRDGRVEGPDEASQAQHYDRLETWLTAYKDMDTPSKPGNMRWPTLEVESIRRGYFVFYQYTQRLGRVTDRLVYDRAAHGDPVTGQGNAE